MAIDRKTLLKRLLILPPLLVGVAIAAYAVLNRPLPQRKPMAETARLVRVITIAETTLVPRAFGYGNVQPGKVFEAVAEVAGRVVRIHPQLKKGAIMAEGQVLAEIDPTDYRLAVKRTEADIRALQAQLNEVEVRVANTRASIAIENRARAIDERELARKRELVEKKVTAQATLDQEERTLLARRQSIQGLTNTLNRLPAERDKLSAQMAALQSQLASARRDLERTTLRAPFDGRIAEVSVEQAQYAKQAQVLAVLDDIGVSEVAAQVPIEKMVGILDPKRLGAATVAGAMKDIERILGVTPIVRLNLGGRTAEWRGRVVRISDTIDPQTRTVGVIVAVKDPYRLSESEFRPPLTKNMFVEVELRGRPLPGRITIPRQALHGDTVYVAGKDNRLVIRRVEIRLRQGGLLDVAKGLGAGERVVITDLIPAIDGMLLAPREDKAAAEALAREAAGGTVP